MSPGPRTRLAMAVALVFGSSCYLSHDLEAEGGRDAALVRDAGIARDASRCDGCECVDGETRACTAGLGECSAEGSQRCAAGRWGECILRETCDRTDDDCDGYVDEGPMRVGEPTAIAPLGSWRYQLARGAFDPSRRQGAALLTHYETDRFQVELARFDAETGTLAGPLTRITSAPSASHDLAFDGVHWTVAVARLDTIALFRVDGDTGASMEVARIEASTGRVTVARMGSSGSDVAVAWAESATSRGRVARFEMPLDAATPATALAPIEPIPSSEGAFVHFALATGDDEGAVAVFHVTDTGTAPYRLLGGPVTRAAVGPFAVLPMPAVVEAWPTHEPSTGALALAIAEPDGERTRVAPLDGGEPLELSDTDVLRLGSSGEPGQLTAFAGRGIPSEGQLFRVRLSDGSVVPGDPLPIRTWNGMVTLRSGAARAVYFEDDGMVLHAYPVFCAID